MARFTFIILTFNEEKNLPACLQSIQQVRDCHVVAVDSFSQDRTLDILREHRVPFMQHPFENYSRQRKWAQQQVASGSQWVFHLDAGERISPELAGWLNHSFDPDGPVDGYMFSRRTFFMDRWIKYGGHYPNYHLRLYRQNTGHCEDKVYDQHFVCTGTTKALPAGQDIIDTVADSLKDFNQSHSRWAYFEAIEILSSKSSADKGEVKASFWGTPIERRRWLKNNVFQTSPLFLRSFLYFFYRYLVKAGFRDGKEGLVFHLLQGFWFRFMVDAVVLELKIKMKNRGMTLEELVAEEYDHKLLQLLQ